MSLNFQRLHETTNQAYAENFRILTQKMADPLLNPALHFLIGIPFINKEFFVAIIASFMKGLLSMLLNLSKTHSSLPQQIFSRQDRYSALAANSYKFQNYLHISRAQSH